jgi:hypothetical protein
LGNSTLSATEATTPGTRTAVEEDAMMPHALLTDSLPVLKAWARQHCRNAVEHAILFHAPDHFSWEDCDQVEERMMDEFKLKIAHLSVDLFQSTRYMNCLITDTVGDTVRLLKQAGRQLQ